MSTISLHSISILRNIAISLVDYNCVGGTLYGFSARCEQLLLIHINRTRHVHFAPVEFFQYNDTFWEVLGRTTKRIPG